LVLLLCYNLYKNMYTISHKFVDEAVQSVVTNPDKTWALSPHYHHLMNTPGPVALYVQ